MIEHLLNPRTYVCYEFCLCIFNLLYQRPVDETYVVNALPEKKDALRIILVGKGIGLRTTKSLGDFEVDYQFDPIGTDALQMYVYTISFYSIIYTLFQG